MVGMNKVILTGRITKDIELRYTQDQRAIVRFTLAVDRRTKDKNESDFISCIAWNKTAELMDKYLSKGSKIGIVGRIQTGSYTDQKGEKHYTTDVMVDELEFLDSKKAEEKNEPKPDADGFVPADDFSDDNLPF